MDNVYELKSRLFEAGEVSITAEAFERIKRGGIEPRTLMERHMRGDWSYAPLEWIEKNHLRLRGIDRHPLISVYQIYSGQAGDSQNCRSSEFIRIATDGDFSKTTITNWPDGNKKARLLPLEAYMNVDKVLNLAATPSRSAKREKAPPARGIDR